MSENEKSMMNDPDLMAALMDAGESDDTQWSEMDTTVDAPKTSDAEEIIAAEEPTTVLTSAKRSSRKSPAKKEEEEIPAPPPAREVMTNEEFLRRQGERSELLRLQSAWRSKRVIRATYDSVTTYLDRLCFCSYLNGVTIYTPLEEAYGSLPPEVPFPPKNRKERDQCSHFMNNSLGANVPLLLTQPFTIDGQTAYAASCVKALNAIYAVYFSKKATRKVSVNDVVDCPIISASSHCLWVEAYGMHCRIPKGNLSLDYIEHANQVYGPGQSIKVSVTKILRDGDKVVGLELNRRPVEVELCRRNISRFVRDSTHVAIVTNVRDEYRDGQKGVIISMFIRGIGLPAFSRSYRPSLFDTNDKELKSGDKVLLRGNGLADVFVHGTIQRKL